MKLRRLISLVVIAGLAGPIAFAQEPVAPSPPGQDPGLKDPTATSGAPELEWIKIRRPEFLSVVRDGGGKATALRTSVVRFEPIDRESAIEHVDLVGAVHVGDRTYYDQLNALFTAYDTVLFEMAHKEDPREDLERRRMEPDMKRLFGLDPAGLLGLESQVARIDYRKANLVHADTSLLDAMERRGDDWLSVLAGLLADLRRQNNLSDRSDGGQNQEVPADESDLFGGLLGFGFSTDPLEMKRRMANQLESQGLDGIPGFTTLNDLLITERNKVAMKRFEEQVAAGKRRIAIFYGAAHMRDFTQRLVVDHGLRPTAMAWLRAWDLRDRGGSGSRKPHSPLELFGGGMDRDAAHDLVDRLFDLLEEMLREEEGGTPRGRRGR